MRIARSVLAVVFASSLGGCGLGGPAYGPASNAAAVVDMANTLTFTPATVHIKAGQTVEWRNRSQYTHTVTDDPRRAKNPADASLPEGAQPFSSEAPPGQVYRHTFTVPGTYRYFCIPHETFGMRGEVIVAPAR